MIHGKVMAEAHSFFAQMNRNATHLYLPFADFEMMIDELRELTVRLVVEHDEDSDPVEYKPEIDVITFNHAGGPLQIIRYHEPHWAWVFEERK